MTKILNFKEALRIYPHIKSADTSHEKYTDYFISFLGEVEDESLKEVLGISECQSGKIWENLSIFFFLNQLRELTVALNRFFGKSSKQ